MAFRRLTALLLLAALLAAPSARAQDAFRAGLAAQAATGPNDPYKDPRPWPDGFAEFMLSRGYSRTPGLLPTNKKALALYDEWRGQPPAPPAPSSNYIPVPGLAAAEKELDRIFDQAADDFKSTFDGSKPPSREPQDPRGPAKPERRGLVFHGLEIGAGNDDLETNQMLAPYDLQDTVERMFDWDVKTRVRLDGFGAVARYRHPENVRSFTVSARNYLDVPAFAQVGGARDAIYDVIGRKPPGELGGYDVGVASVIDEHWGASAGWHDKTRKSDEQSTEERVASLGAGYTPLGDNGGRPWNYTLLAGVNHAQVERDDAAGHEEKAGFGWSTGVAFRHSLEAIGIPWLNPEGGRHDDGVWLDRFTASFGVADSEISDLSVRASVGASAYVTKHLRVSCEFGATCVPETGKWSFDPSAGGTIRF